MARMFPAQRCQTEAEARSEHLTWSCNDETCFGIYILPWRSVNDSLSAIGGPLSPRRAAQYPSCACDGKPRHLFRSGCLRRRVSVHRSKYLDVFRLKQRGAHGWVWHGWRGAGKAFQGLATGSVVVAACTMRTMLHREMDLQDGHRRPRLHGQCLSLFAGCGRTVQQRGRVAVAGCIEGSKRPRGARRNSLSA
ncbi:hypothetical protein M011DRAFT_85770 [Sporormia fimetaria CBS 119925]|uniref:Uncharacterized protein n=1 Tax=Sporormia fimetaria CBS 119925 TaxID=1340428 RepID=A0A6A6VAF5_9PLEO|nr:hypothetical protein M011DRAFT_85770 [Sporormia fimetaria CBS 119925]